MLLKELHKGEYFTKKAIEYPNSSQVYVKGEYDRSTKKYSCYRFDDVNKECFILGSKEVYVGFTF